MATLNHALDPTTHPDAGSEQASMITVDSEDMTRFKVPSFAALFRDMMPAYLAKWIADEELKDKAEKEKRKRDGAKTADERLSKCRCMDGANLAPRAIGVPMAVVFPQSLFDTEICVPLPLPFFTNKSLRYITDNSAILPTVKSNPLPGETKGISILDVDKLSAVLGKELSLDFSQWSKAAENMYAFQEEREVSGAQGIHALWFCNHFGFFTHQRDKVEEYGSWKALELELCHEFQSKPTSFDASYYVSKYDHAKTKYALEALMMARLNATVP